jgi:hypothetical protein
VGHAVLSQNRKVHRREKLLVPDLHRKPPVSRQFREEFIQPGREYVGIDAARLREGLKLEDEWTHMVREIPLVRLIDLFVK